MSKTRLLIGVLALGSGLVAAFMGMKVINKKPKQEVVEVNKVETVDVLVASKQITMATSSPAAPSPGRNGLRTSSPQA